MPFGDGDARSHGCNASAAAPATAEEGRARHPLFETKTTGEGGDTGAAAIASVDEGGDIGAAAAAIASADEGAGTGAAAITSADDGGDTGAAAIAVRRMVDQCRVGLETT